ncbi:glutathione S-transferase family protein [Herbaspirillum robiniae]|uniref:Glutathione S-transferase family protein n=1 Tax=Herbaspirillum robiniae TaxID=2014887 RepID=A0ABX2M055_9BURK|nr:glutathione S-transferase family protein [Herbaspirillum robiniae]NUU04082.1 glutathione S-transferase family protein [Herbaspirillum robiniae]
MLTIHHLGVSQSERIVWLCEELALPYELVRYTRDAVTRLSPPALRQLHPLGAAPVIQDGELMLGESAAIVDYILAKFGNGRLKAGPGQDCFADYLYWFHFANGNLQPIMLRYMTLLRTGLPADHPVIAGTMGRLQAALALMDERLAKASYLAGEEFTAADIMTVFSLTTMRVFQPVDLAPYPHIRAYLARIGERPGYRRAMEICDPGMARQLS